MENNEQLEIVEDNERGVMMNDDPRINYRGWKVMPFIIGNETFEKLGTIGTLANLLVYLTSVFNLSSISAINIINIFNGSANLATLPGAFLSDTYFGRYRTLGFCTFSSFLGLLVIELTALIKGMHPPHCSNKSTTCIGPSTGQMAFLLIGFGFLTVGAAGIRPCNLAFGADQFNPNTESGKKGVNSFFNWYFFTFTFAQIVSLSIVVYIQSDVSWALGLGIPAALMLFSCILFFFGSKYYVKFKATGSPLTSMVQVMVVAVKKRRLEFPLDSLLFSYMPPQSTNSKLPHTSQFSMQQVEEVKCLLKVIPIWVSGMLYYIPIIQQSIMLVFQALQSDRRVFNTNFKIPAASYTIFTMLSLTIWLPIYDRVVVPWLRKLTGKEGGITLLQRMGIGIFLSVLSMLVSGVVENQRRNMALAKPVGWEPTKGAISSMSGLWLVPQLLLAGLSDGFTAVGQVEFFYKQFPENMRSVGGSLFFCGLAGASYLSSLLTTIVHRVTGKSATGNWLPQDLNKGRLDYFFYLTSVLQLVNLGFFILCAKWYKYK